VNQSAGPLPDGCDPGRLISIASSDQNAFNVLSNTHEHKSALTRYGFHAKF